jgi:hypothetical protein
MAFVDTVASRHHWENSDSGGVLVSCIGDHVGQRLGQGHSV